MRDEEIGWEVEGWWNKACEDDVSGGHNDIVGRENLKSWLRDVVL